MNILITGGTGFIGSAVVRRVLLDGCGVRESTKRLTGNADWMVDLQGIDVVIHTAARAHVMRERAADPLAEFRRVNVEGTLQLARQAAEAGVKRFIFLSSIKVNGERTVLSCPFTANDIPAPEDAYGRSKLEAEQGLSEITQGSAMELVIIRPPLVYGPGVKGNMAALIKLVARGVPLPLGAVDNQRSLVALDNLIDFISLCVAHPAAANQIFLISDGEDISTTQLLQCMAQSMKKQAWLMPFPPFLLRFIARLVGKEIVAQKLCDSLQVDITKNQTILGWTPPLNVKDAIERMVIAAD